MTVGHAPYYRDGREKESNIHLYRLDHGLTVAELAAACNTSPSMICGLQNGMVAPVYLSGENRRDRRDGQMKPSAKELIKLFGCEFSDLFPRYECKIPSHNDLTDDQVADILNGDYNKRDEDSGFLSKAVEDLLAAALTHRERFVIRAHVFNNKTLRFCGEHLDGLSVEGVRLIYAKALRKLRHPAYQRFLDGWGW